MHRRIIVGVCVFISFFALSVVPTKTYASFTTDQINSFISLLGAFNVDPATTQAAAAALGAPTHTTSPYYLNASSTHAWVLTYYYDNVTGSYAAAPWTWPYSNISYNWGDAVQTLADFRMWQVNGSQTYMNYVNSGFNFINTYLWDPAGGGYRVQANLDGSDPSTQKFVDEQALEGIINLEVYSATLDPNRLAKAESVANYLMYSGLWDSTYGGGFWWNNGAKNDTDPTIQMKGTIQNALAAQLFYRLCTVYHSRCYPNGKAGGDKDYYLLWGDNTLSWVNSKMKNSGTGLYDWYVTSKGRNTTEFAYEQGAVIDAYLERYALFHASADLVSARAIANNAHASVLWNPTYKVFITSSANGNIDATFNGWLSSSLLHLRAFDNNSNWASWAKSNIDRVNTCLRTSSGGYYDYSAPDCSNINKTRMDETAQAYMQAAQAQLSVYY